METIVRVFPGQPITAVGYNQLVDTANVVNTMTGNVIHGAKGIHIPKQKAVKDISITYKAVPAMGPDGETYDVGTVVRIVGAFGPSTDEPISSEWTAFVCAVDMVDEASHCEGHVGYGIVTETVAYDFGVGAVAIWGEVPVIVTHKAGQTPVAPGYSYAVIDVNGTTPEIPFVYGKLKAGCVAAFRVLYEDVSGTLTAPHWALVRVDMGNEIDDQCVSIKSTFADAAITDGQPVEITGEEDGYLVVDRPTEDSIPAPRILFPVGKIGTASDNPYGFARAGTTPIWVGYTGDAPVIGDEMGTVEDSFDFKKDNTGFMCVGVDTGGSKCLVRPFSSGVGYTIEDIIVGSMSATAAFSYDGNYNAELYATEVTFAEPFEYVGAASAFSFTRFTGTRLTTTTGLRAALSAAYIDLWRSAPSAGWVRAFSSPAQRAEATGDNITVSSTDPVPAGYDGALSYFGGVSDTGTYTKARIAFRVSLATGETGTGTVVWIYGAVSGVYPSAKLISIYKGVSF